MTTAKRGPSPLWRMMTWSPLVIAWGCTVLADGALDDPPFGEGAFGGGAVASTGGAGGGPSEVGTGAPSLGGGGDRLARGGFGGGTAATSTSATTAGVTSSATTASTSTTSSAATSSSGAGGGSVASCDDGVANGTESDVDCGGLCASCGLGALCGGDADCASDRCKEGFCVECVQNHHCPNGTYCDGGYCEPLKPDGAPCSHQHQCLSGDCDDGICDD